jgi:hypothetical protein
LLICFLCFFLIFQTNITESTKDFKIINKTFKLNRTISYYLLSYFRDNNILVNLIFGIILFILSFVFEQFRSILVVSSCVLILSNTAYLHMNTFSLKTNIISKAKGVKIILIAHFIFFLFSVILASIVNSVVNNFTFFELFLVPMLVYVFSDIVKAKNDMLVFISLFLSFVIFFMIKYIFQTLDTSLISMIQVLLIILACLQVYYSWYEQDK